MIQLKNDDAAKLILRLTVGILMLSHGIGKIMHGIDGVQAMTVAVGLPQWFAYGVYIGEVIAPILLIVGYYGRMAALVITFTMANAIYMANGGDLFALNTFGAPVIELPLFYMMAALAIFLLGSGKYSIRRS